MNTINKKILIAALIGNALEWYDFSLYGYISIVISKIFFTSADKTTSLIATFAIFGVGFLTRPLGAILFGHFGDRFGRKKTLVYTILLMSFATAAIGILPTYSQAGISATVLLTFCRLLQGIAAGGEFAGSMIYIVEHAHTQRRGFYGSLVMVSAYGGALLGSSVCLLASHIFTETDLYTWGWRIPFLLSIFLGILGLYLRIKLVETPPYLALKASQEIVKKPLLVATQHEWLSMLKALGLVFLPTMSGYLLFVYLPTYTTHYLNYPLELSLLSNTASMAIIVIILPCMGLLADKKGRKPLLILSALNFGLLAYPLFILLVHGKVLGLLISQVLFALLVGCAFATIPTTLVELFTTKIRCTALSLPYNLATAIFGGTTPIVATLMITKTNNLLSPSFYLIFAAIIMLMTALSLKESFQKNLI